MDIKLVQKYKSLQPFEWKDIPKFAVLTGLNGTGKSQLLQIIHASLINSSSIRERIEVSGENYKRHDVSRIAGEWQLESIGPIDYSMTINELHGHYGDFLNKGNWYQNNEDKRWLNKVGAYESVLLELEEENPKSVTRETFIKLFPKFFGESESRITYAVSTHFSEYRLAEINLLAKQKTPFEIQEELGEKPWEVVRSILKDNSVPFEINDPSECDLYDQFHLQLTHKVSGEVIDFSDLSSGEKVILSIAFFLYSSKKKRILPKLFLLDEPDAHLHPSMARQFLDVMKTVLVDQFGARVLMTTHSPSTVALADDESIFTAHSEGDRIRKTTKDAALKLLTSGVPSFSVNYENRRQVFVESPFDVSFYERIYRRIIHLLEPAVSLTFIASGDAGRDKNGQPVSTCEQVVRIASTLRGAGNKFVWGLIDWDGKNSESDFIKVIGNGNRYAIETYLLDPLLVAVLLIREKIWDRSVSGLEEGQTYLDIKNLENVSLQGLANRVIKEINLKVQPSETVMSTQKLLDGRVIDVPSWYLEMQGHLLENKVLEAFPSLHAFKRNTEDGLKNAIIDKVIDDIPDIISEDFVHLFKSLQAV